MLPIALCFFAFLVYYTADKNKSGQTIISISILTVFLIVYLVNFRRLRRVYFDDKFVYIKPMLSDKTEKLNFKQVKDFFSGTFFFSTTGGPVYKLKYQQEDGTQKTVNVYPTMSFKNIDQFKSRLK